MSEELTVFLATIYGEAANQSEAAWKAIAHTIMNRFQFREWKKYATIHELIAGSGFDAFTQRNIPYQRAYSYFSRDRLTGTNERLEGFYKLILPIYESKEYPHNDERYVMYYSPKAQAFLHNKDPKTYTRIKPKWADSPLVREVKVPGCEADDFAFYAYV